MRSGPEKAEKFVNGLMILSAPTVLDSPQESRGPVSQIEYFPSLSIFQTREADPSQIMQIM